MSPTLPPPSAARRSLASADSSQSRPSPVFFRRGRWLLLLLCLWCAGASRALALRTTPSCTEGPYYTFSPDNLVTASNSPYYDAHFFTAEGTDSDLTHVNASAGQCTGTVFLLSGTLTNDSGIPIAGATIELWEADNNGIYPYVSASGNNSANNYAGRDKFFQGYGRTTTDVAGAWSFRTIRPGKAVGRLRHYNFKVSIAGKNVLTSEFLFAEDSGSFSSDSVAQELARTGSIDLVTLHPTTGTDASGNPVFLASSQILLTYSGGNGGGPAIITQPVSQTVTVGGSATFSVVASGTGPLFYRWYKSSGMIDGAGDSSYTLANASFADTDSYYVTVTDSVSTTASSSAALTVVAANSAPTITTQPASQTAAAGSSATFSVAAAGSGTLSYQWFKGATALARANSSSYTIADVTTGSAGSYSVKVTNFVGSATSDAATLTVTSANAAPTITSQPASQTAPLGSSATFTVAAAGGGTLAYQWYKGGDAIAGANGASYTITSVTADSAGSYNAAVSNAYGSVSSSIARLTVSNGVVAPAINSPPASLTVKPGDQALFLVSASGSAPLHYQWYKDGSALVGAGDSSYVVASASADNAGAYTVAVSNSAGAATSSAAVLKVSADAPPVITAQPVSLAAAAGGGAAFSVTASGSAPLIYQWYKNGAVIAGATDAAYLIAAVTANSAGVFSAVVSNGSGSTASDGATLTVAAATGPAITGQPVSQTAASGSSVTFSVTASGAGTLSYQWYHDGSAIPGAMAASYTVNAVSPDSAGSYDAVVTDANGTAASLPAALTIGEASAAPMVTTQPVSQKAAVGASVTFAVAASGSGALSYRWFKGYTPLPDATGASFTIPSVASEDGGVYDVVVSNNLGSVTSATAVLTVNFGAAAVNLRAGGGGDFRVGGDKGILIFTRAGGDLAGELTISFQVKGSAKDGRDFTETDGAELGTSATFPAGANKLKVKLAGVADGKAAGSKVVNVKLLPSPTGEYVVGDSKRAKLRLIDLE